MRRAVFLDRDGVLNRAVIREGKPYPPRDHSEFEIIADVPDALRRLREAGYLLLAVTNQPDVARGLTPRAWVDKINGILCFELGLDTVMTCFHDDQDDCQCRKPRPGQLFAARDVYDLDLSNCYLIGDRWRDVLAAQNAECRSIFIDCRYSEIFAAPPPDFTCSSLSEAVDWILADSSADMKG